MSSSERELVQGVLSACREASRAILDIYGRDDFTIESKDDESPLTAADMASHRILVAVARQLRG